MEYDGKVNRAFKEARRYLSSLDPPPTSSKPHVKFQRLEIPKFESNPKRYFKWEETFNRFTENFDINSKYNYLLASTVGEANKYVANRSNFIDAMSK